MMDTDLARLSLGRAFLSHAKRLPRRAAVVDLGGEISYLRLAGAALALRARLGLAEDERRVGVLLPPGRGGALANVALTLGGRVAVNLNHTVGNVLMAQMAELAGLRTIITAHAYLDRLEGVALPPGLRPIYAEDLIAGLSKRAAIWNMLKVLALPAAALDPAPASNIATLVFSSGSTGTPKGVEHNHTQLLANIHAIREHLELQLDAECVLSPLPLFHAFGLIPGLWLGLALGFTVAAHPDPRDGTGLGRLAARAKPTFLISTPTFVRMYMRRITADQFATLRFTFAGAEKCPEDLKQAFWELYHSRLLEGYGSTEMGVAVAINTPDNSRPGTVGRPLANTEVFTIHPETREMLPAGEAGLIVARSPSALASYLDRPDLTQAAFAFGGYIMGDMGHVDEDGYLHIAGRLARFAKIAGEMVPLDKIEEALQAFVASRYPDVPFDLGVAAVRDETKGERLLVLHTALPCSLDELHHALEQLPPIFRPRAKDFHEVAELPLLGTGKRDLGKLRSMAEAIAANAEDEARPEPQRPANASAAGR